MRGRPVRSARTELCSKYLAMTLCKLCRLVRLHSGSLIFGFIFLRGGKEVSIALGLEIVLLPAF